ncbi:hypothetical protein QF026_004156 [Streptomyces aurantiacus]|uniref:ABC transporter permease n=1 Tax=Streptomyces aurantiacus TaxID=47760 RepID=UPI002793E314|nr:ABC transporter permease [Streptomyces aurantiacus]MDQ0775690.1 hypothetical protein [Streptomyces aurantiacus]
MSTVLRTPARTAGPTHAPRPWAAVSALARFEARELRMITSVFGTAILYMVWTGYEVARRQGDFPVLQDVDRDTQIMPILFGLVVMMNVNRGVLRSRRYGTDRHFDVLVVEPWRRTVAHVLSVVPAALFTAACVTFQFSWAAFKPGAAGTGSLAELAVGPLTVLLCGAGGVLLARLFPSVFAAPLLLVVLLFGMMFVATPAGPAWTSRLSPVVTFSGASPFPSDMLGRLAGWHALYLLGLVLFMALLAVLLSGGRTTVVKAAVAGSLALTLVGVVGQSQGTPAAALAARERGSVTPEKVRTCVEHGKSSYCAFPEWTSRTDDWAAVADRVQSLAGGRAGTERLTVDQRLDARNGLDSDTQLSPSGAPGHVSVGMDWGGNRVPEFAVAVASVLVAGDEKAASELCDARVVTIMWMALRGASDPMGSLRDVRLDDSDSGSAFVLSPTESFGMSAEQTRVVAELLQKPRYDVAGKVKAKWTELTAPKTSIERVAELLGVPAAGKTTDGADEDGRAGSCEE